MSPCAQKSRRPRRLEREPSTSRTARYVSLRPCTGASGFQRLANQAHFFGQARAGRHYLVIDDFVGQGGTLENLIGFIESQGGHVVGATVLTGKPYTANLAPDAR